ncbi:hypothetical protein [Mucilaginibacter sp.]|uniref:hypothetical protein n=1 Tax=Mucilaginibacter sp. TaxID=1882438 RepID=UPI003262FCC0
MRSALTVCLLFASMALGQNNCSPNDFKKLFTLSNQATVSDPAFTAGLKIFKKLEAGKCYDYTTKNAKRQDSVIASRTEIFGDICLKANSRRAIKEYIAYLNRHTGSAEEQLSFSFERLFVQQPADVLSVIGTDKRLLGHLVWGFVNNHYNAGPDNSKLNSKNYSAIFYRVNPHIKQLYPKYKIQIDYLLSAIKSELKG